MSKQIQVRVYPDGKIESKTIGVKGKSCMKYIKVIEDLTSAKTYKSEFTQEYYEKQNERNSTYHEEYQKNGY